MVLSQPLADAINNSISKGVFPDNAKFASLSPIEKQLNDKNMFSNFRPVSVLNIFSKSHESVIKISLLHHILQSTVSFHTTCIHQKNGEKVLIRITLWAESMDLLKAFDCIPHDLLQNSLHMNLIVMP